MPFCGIYIDSHFCGGNIKSIGVYDVAKKCSMDAEVFLGCSEKRGTEIEKQGCCSQKSVFNKLTTNKLPKTEVLVEVPFYTAARKLNTKYFIADGNKLYSKFRKPPDHNGPSLTQIQVFII